MTLLSAPSRALVATRHRVHARPTVEPSRMMRYRGGTYSHTVDRIVFIDGTTARTDLIRLNPNLRAYSLDFAGIAPHQPSRYRLDNWSALPHLRDRDCEAEVDWILRHSYPMGTIAELSEQLRRAGYPLGRANISEHEAIAGTQAAIWHFTNGLNLDTRPLNAPIAVHRGPGSTLTFEFDGQPQLGGFTMWASADAAGSVKLQKSTDGREWQDVSGSHLAIDAGKGRYRRTLGVGSTVSTSKHSNGRRGYRYYRLVSSTPGTLLDIDHVDFWLTGSGHHRNADRVVHLYNYLLAGAYAARRNSEPAPVDDREATVEGDLVGPFRVRVPLKLSAPDGHRIVDADGFALDSTVQPGTDFYLHRIPGISAITLSGSTPHPIGGRVLTGVALDGPDQRFTPVALTVPTKLTIEFDISWHEAWSDL
ncbi:thioester domain-containing protein [Mycobacterium asiaticum]|uniref:TQXA domain-containing protein n=1 Tax=Mycobacterium asiaticum TaxID=1790 RepID=A0A1A3CYU4_MYCAS|nr:thioester domain-containing protein [Mycobacterium asiaticum]OBI91969.1 TQXA domain-containing protein [Mycobacterium asiaticum]